MHGIRRLLDRKQFYSGRIIEVTVDQVELENNLQTIREVVAHPGGAVVLAWNPEGKILFVRQPRYPLNKELLELPAGKLDGKEDPAQAAKRELEEETGYTAEKWSHLTSFYTSPGFCTEQLHLYLAEGLIPGSVRPEHDEMITMESHTLEEALVMVQNGGIQDAKTIMGILWARAFSCCPGT